MPASVSHCSSHYIKSDFLKSLGTLLVKSVSLRKKRCKSLPVHDLCNLAEIVRADKCHVTFNTRTSVVVVTDKQIRKLNKSMTIIMLEKIIKEINIWCTFLGDRSNNCVHNVIMFAGEVLQTHYDCFITFYVIYMHQSLQDIIM